MTSRRYFFSCLWVTLILTACLFRGSVMAGSEPVKIGIVHSGGFPFATMMLDAYEMALLEIHRQGGINGRELKLIHGDDQGSRHAGEALIKEMVEKKGVKMLVGGYSSKNTVYMAGMAEKLDMPFLICTAADDRITQRGWENIYRLNPPASQYTSGLEKLFEERIKPKSMAVVYENSPYGTDAALRMMWFCREHDVNVRRIIPYHRERKSPEYYTRILAPLKTEGEAPDVIYMASYLQDAVKIVKEIRKLKIQSLLAGGAGGFTHPKFIVEAGDAANLLLTATLWFHEMKYPGTRAFYDAYLKRYGAKPDYHAAEAYAAIMVAADALRRAKSFTPEAIRMALTHTDMTTPFGPVRFESFGKFKHQNRLPTQVLQIIQRQFELIWPADLATAAFEAPPDWRRSP